MSLSGKVLCFTGSLRDSRSVCTVRAEAAGATVTASVTKKTTHLVAGPGAGGKVDEATAKGVVVWSEEEFFAMLNGSPTADSTTSSDAAPVKGKGKRIKAAAIKQEDTDVTPAPATKKGKTAKKVAEPAAEKSLDGASLTELVLCFSGSLCESRSVCTVRAEAAGASVSASVTAKTTHLVAGPGAGGKVEAAKAKGVIVWSEDDFFAMINGNEVVGGSAAPKATTSGSAAKKEAGASKAKQAESVAAKSSKKSSASLEPPASPIASSSSSSKSAALTSPGGGKRPDRCVPNAAAYSVCGDLDAKLMQTNIGDGSNNNKFYILQTLYGEGQYRVIFRWGRLGETGQSKIEDFPDLASAQTRFEKQFREKTKNAWANRAKFVKYSDKYQLVEVDDDDEGGGGGGACEGAALGKLSIAQIEKGQAVLTKIRAALGNSSSTTGKQKASSSASLVDLSGQFYSLIPTTSGRVKPPPLNNLELVEEKEGLLEFWLRMGFESVETEPTPLGDSPIDGVHDLPLPKTLRAAASSVSDASSIQQSQSRGAQLAKVKAGSPTKAISAELYGAICLYTGNSIYRALNQALRENWQAVKPYHNYLRMYFEAMDRLPHQATTLWRGIAADLYDSYKEGSIQTWWSISSCTSAKGVAEGFMAQLGGKATLLTLQCKNAVDVSRLSLYPHEAESLLLPGTRLRVLSRKRVGNVAHITVEEVQ